MSPRGPAARPRTPARPRSAGRAAALAFLAALAGGCVANEAGEEAGSAGGGDGVPAEIRFAIEVEAGDHPPVLVQATSESRPVGWLRVLREGAPVHVEERCDIPDCDDPGGAVCGATIPTVREVAPADAEGTIAYLWDLTRSVIDADQCERREPAPPGDYVARFCYGYSAEVDGDPAERWGALGRLTSPTCVDRAFRVGRDADVVLRIP